MRFIVSESKLKRLLEKIEDDKLKWNGKQTLYIHKESLSDEEIKTLKANNWYEGKHEIEEFILIPVLKYSINDAKLNISEPWITLEKINIDTSKVIERIREKIEKNILNLEKKYKEEDERRKKFDKWLKTPEGRKWSREIEKEKKDLEKESDKNVEKLYKLQSYFDGKYSTHLIPKSDDEYVKVRISNHTQNTRNNDMKTLSFVIKTNTKEDSLHNPTKDRFFSLNSYEWDITNLTYREAVSFIKNKIKEA